MCKMVCGTNWSMKVCMEGKKCYVDMKCAENPEFNQCGVYIEGKECEVDMPGLGKVRITQSLVYYVCPSYKSQTFCTHNNNV